MLKRRQIITIVSIAVMSFLIGTTFNVMTMAADGGNPFERIWKEIYGFKSDVDSLNASLVELQSAIETLEARLETRIDVLNATVANLLPHNETYSTTQADISSYPALYWQNMSDMSVEITLTTKSMLLIMFSAQARLSGIYRRMYVQAVVDATPATSTPAGVIFTESDEWAAHSHTFYSPNVAAGTHTITMQWKLYDELSTGQVKERTLTVIALPTS